MNEQDIMKEKKREGLIKRIKMLVEVHHLLLSFDYIISKLFSPYYVLQLHFFDRLYSNRE